MKKIRGLPQFATWGILLLAALSSLLLSSCDEEPPSFSLPPCPEDYVPYWPCR